MLQLKSTIIEPKKSLKKFSSRHDQAEELNQATQR
jgi:hypothetical protein